MALTVRPLPEQQLDDADRVFRLAFGTFLGLPDPLQFGGDSDMLRPRWHAKSPVVLAAYDGSRLVGSNVVTRWGSFGFFGPLTVLPEYWGRGVAQALLGETLAQFDAWQTQQRALFTFPHSTQHVHLYQKFGFWPQMLTPVMAKRVAAALAPAGTITFATLSADQRITALAACRELTDQILPGLDLSSEITALAAQQLGDTVLVYEDQALVAFAVCHAGKGSEAGSDTAYIKFGAARPSSRSAVHFEQLLAASEAFAAQRRLTTLKAGTNVARIEAYQQLLRHGFRTIVQGVAMQNPNSAGTLRPGLFVIDDWR